MILDMPANDSQKKGVTIHFHLKLGLYPHALSKHLITS